MSLLCQLKMVGVKDNSQKRNPKELDLSKRKVDLSKREVDLPQMIARPL
jgi:hypothetical protein